MLALTSIPGQDCPMAASGSRPRGQKSTMKTPARPCVALFLVLAHATRALADGRPITIDDLLAVKACPTRRSRLTARSSTSSPSWTGDREENSSLGSCHTGGEPKRLTTAPAPTTSRVGARRQVDRVCLHRGGSAQSGFCRWTAARPASSPNCRSTSPGRLVTAGRQDRLHRRGVPGANPRANFRQGQGEGSIEDEGSRVRPFDDPALERLGRRQAQPPIRRRYPFRRSPRPDQQA